MQKSNDTKYRSVHPVLHIFEASPRGSTGGVDTYIRELAHYWEKNSKDSLVFFVIHDSALADELIERGYKVITIPKLNRFARRPLKILRQFMNLIHDSGIQVIHSHGYRADYFVFLMRSLFIRKWGKVPWVVQCHGWISTNFKHKLQTFVNMIILKFATVIITVCDEMKEQLLKKSNMNPNKIIVLKNTGTNKLLLFEKSKKRTKHSDLTIAGVGRLSKEKRWDLFIDTAFKLLEKYPKTTFKIIGEGTMKDRLQKQIAKLNIEKNVRLEGFIRDQELIYCDVDILVICSDSEGIPFVMLEAMSRGIPVVATSVGGIPEVITDGFNGLLVPRGDCEALGGVISRLLENEELRKNLAKRAKKHLLGIDQNIIPEELVKIYLKLRQKGIN